MPRSKGRSGRPWNRLRRQVLQTSDTCWICGHPAADTVDHLIPISVDPTLAEDVTNLRPAHGTNPCPTCHRRCNTARGNRMNVDTPTRSRTW